MRPVRFDEYFINNKCAVLRFRAFSKNEKERSWTKKRRTLIAIDRLVCKTV